MPGSYCRGCGRSKTEMKVADPRHCKRCGPLLVKSRTYCEWCGGRLHQCGADPCGRCGRKAARFFGR